MFQPFLRFWYDEAMAIVHAVDVATVSTLLEILATGTVAGQPPAVKVKVSTLLEILGLVYQVLVGF